VLPKNLPSAGGKWNMALFVPFSNDVDVAVAKVDMVEFDLTEL